MDSVVTAKYWTKMSQRVRCDGADVTLIVEGNPFNLTAQERGFISDLESIMDRWSKSHQE